MSDRAKRTKGGFGTSNIGDVVSRGGEGGDEGTKENDEGTRPESYPKFTARASNVAPAGALHLKRLLAIFMCTYVVIERERDVKARNCEGPFPAVGCAGPKGPVQ